MLGASCAMVVGLWVRREANGPNGVPHVLLRIQTTSGLNNESPPQNLKFEASKRLMCHARFLFSTTLAALYSWFEIDLWVRCPAARITLAKLAALGV